MLLPEALKPPDAGALAGPPKCYSLYNSIAAQLLRGVPGGVPLEYFKALEALEALELVSA